MLKFEDLSFILGIRESYISLFDFSFMRKMMQSIFSLRDRCFFNADFI